MVGSARAATPSTTRRACAGPYQQQAGIAAVQIDGLTRRRPTGRRSPSSTARWFVWRRRPSTRPTPGCTASIAAPCPVAGDSVGLSRWVERCALSGFEQSAETVA